MGRGGPYGGLRWKNQAGAAPQGAHVSGGGGFLQFCGAPPEGRHPGSARIRPGPPSFPLRPAPAILEGAMKATLVQPPFVQLNAPYPAVYYLETFLKDQGHEACAFDHSIELFRTIFSRAGLTRVFADAQAAFSSPNSPLRGADKTARLEIERYLSYADLYTEWIDGIVSFLAGQDPGFAHRLSSAAELPHGARASALLEANEGRVSLEQTRELATDILDDLGDFIRFSLDPEFSTVRYGDRLARSQGDFSEVEAGLRNGYLIGTFYRPYLKDFWTSRSSDLVLISVPFPGCLVGALACAEAARAALGPDATIILGGGYVNTELRGLRDSRIFNYCDYLSFDAGFGSIASIISRVQKTRASDASRHGEFPAGTDSAGTAATSAAGAAPAAAGAAASAAGAAPAAAPDRMDTVLYKSMYRRPDGSVAAEGFVPGQIPAVPGAPDFSRLEAELLLRIFPDYSSADFRRYLGVVDSENPMHRLWSDTVWLKYSLAHGCYWHRCEFCDTELDYVGNYVPADISALMRAADAASARHNLYGIHFVDEAMPMSRLLAFARANRARAREGRRPFYFWGNVRFDASWTEDRAEFLVHSGLVAVSGGIEIATGKGLTLTGKGFDLAGLVRCLVAMRRSGLLIHAYLIYGFPGETKRDIADSAEVVRQLFAAGAIDSAFWHRFVLTRNSRIMAEWKQGLHPGLKPVDRDGAFAANDLSFGAESNYDEFDSLLDSRLEAWMSGADLDEPYPGAQIPPGLIEALITQAETALDARRAEIPAQASGTAERAPGTAATACSVAVSSAPRPGQRRAFWIGGHTDLTAGHGGTSRLSWVYRGDMQSISLESSCAAELSAVLAEAAAPDGIPLDSLLASIVPRLSVQSMGALRGAGLLFI